MLRIILCTAILLAGEVACGGDLSYPPPPQRERVRDVVKAVLPMTPGQGDAPWALILQDVLPPAPDVDWRWTRAHPSFRFTIIGSEGWSFSAKVTVVKKVFQATGPQHLEVAVNGHAVSKTTFDRPGSYELNVPVAADILKNSDQAEVRLDIDPCLLSGSPGENKLPLCVLLHSIGFVRAGR